MSERSSVHVAIAPLVGDVFELRQRCDGDERLYRVLWFGEDHVLYKEYGAGRFVVHKNAWKQLVEEAVSFKWVRRGDSELPF